MTCIIAIETATEACSAAVLVQNDGTAKLYKRFQLAPREHTKLILPMLDEVLDEAGLKKSGIDAIAFGRGPGAFTGLRIASGIAQGLALSVDKPTIPISSLKAMALAAQQASSTSDKEMSIVVAIDARMGEVYWVEYAVKAESLEQIGEEQLSAPAIMFEKAQSLAEQGSITIIGSGWDEYLPKYKEQYTGSNELDLLANQFPNAEQISQLALIAYDKGELKAIDEAQPVYLRNNVAEKSKKNL